MLCYLLNAGNLSRSNALSLLGGSMVCHLKVIFYVSQVYLYLQWLMEHWLKAFIIRNGNAGSPLKMRLFSLICIFMHNNNKYTVTYG